MTGAGRDETAGWGLQAVTVRHGATRALDDVSCDIAPGTVMAVIGADGAGKTTLARTLVGLVTPDQGEVRRPERSALGYQPEAAGTWQDLTVVENLSFVASTHAGTHGLAARTEQLLAVTGLAEASGRLAGALSGGMRQKLAVAMAMLPAPRMLVADEPTTGLDPVSRIEVWRLLARAAGEGMAVVATTSYLDEAQRADQVVVLDAGRVLVAGTAADIRADFPGWLVGSDVADVADDADVAPGDAVRWRRGSQWRAWWRQRPPAHVRLLEPDLEDVVMAAALDQRGAP